MVMSNISEQTLKERLIQCFEEAERKSKVYIGVAIETEGSEGLETIINPHTNFKQKLEYYKKAYNDDLQLIAAPDKIRIVDFAIGNTFSEIQYALIIK